MKVVADENIPGLERLADAGVDLLRRPGRDIAAADVGDAQALLIRSVTRIDEDLLACAPRLRYVGTATSGYDHVDRESLRHRGIAFAHAPGANANSVVEYVLSAIAETDDYLERLLAGGRVGIVGYGHIGQLLGRRLDALGVAWCVSDPWKEQQAGIPNAASLGEVLAADVVTLHAELTDAKPYPSRHLLHARNLASLSRGTLLINASRGPVVDNAALRKRLHADDAPVTVLDVWEGEPFLDTELLALARLGSAHIAGYSWDSKLLATQMLLSAMASAVNIAPLPAPSDAAPALATLDKGARGAALIRSLLAGRYRVGDDDRRLREALHGAQSAACRGRAFDALRRDYRRRWELAGSRVSDPGWNPSQWKQAMALGVEPV